MTTDRRDPVTLRPTSAAEREHLRAALIEAAGDEPWRVQYDTSDPAGLGFTVDRALAEAVGELDGDHDTGDAQNTVDAPARNASGEKWITFVRTLDGFPEVADDASRSDVLDLWDVYATEHGIDH